MSVTRFLILSGLGLAAVLVVTLELLARREGARIPTLAELCAAATRTRLGRVPVGQILLLTVWWWVGWHFFAR